MDTNNRKQQHEDKSEGIETTVDVVGSLIESSLSSTTDAICGAIEVVGEVLSGLN